MYNCAYGMLFARMCTCFKGSIMSAFGRDAIFLCTCSSVTSCTISLYIISTGMYQNSALFRQAITQALTEHTRNSLREKRQSLRSSKTTSLFESFENSDEIVLVSAYHINVISYILKVTSCM